MVILEFGAEWPAWSVLFIYTRWKYSNAVAAAEPARLRSAAKRS